MGYYEPNTSHPVFVVLFVVFPYLGKEMNGGKLSIESTVIHIMRAGLPTQGPQTLKWDFGVGCEKYKVYQFGCGLDKICRSS